MIPNADSAVVAIEKITEYLLNPIHADGGPKARFFLSFGFSDQEWEVIAAALCSHPRTYEVVSAYPREARDGHDY